MGRVFALVLVFCRGSDGNRPLLLQETETVFYLLDMELSQGFGLGLFISLCYHLSIPFGQRRLEGGDFLFDRMAGLTAGCRYFR